MYGLEFNPMRRPRLRIPLLVPLDEIDSKAEWTAQKFFSICYCMFIFIVCIFVPLLVGSFFALRGMERGTQDDVFTGLTIFAFVGILMCGPYGHKRSLAGTEEEQEQKWNSLPWWTWSPFDSART